MSAERSFVENIKALVRALTERRLRAEPVPLAFTSGAYAPPRGVPWQRLRDAITLARSGTWGPLNELEREAAPSCPIGVTDSKDWRIVQEVLRGHRMVGYVWRQRGNCETCNGSGEEDAETTSGRQFSVECDSCDGTGMGEDFDGDEVITNLVGEHTTVEALCP